MLNFQSASAPFVGQLIIFAEKDNFLHLTGVSTKLSATAFFDKCLDGSLTEMDFEIGASGCDAKSAKGSVRRKIKVLPLIGDLFLHNCEVEEDFTKNTVFCSFASSDGSCTLGFIAIPKARPKTLLSGNELDRGKPGPLQIVLSKERTKPQSFPPYVLEQTNKSPAITQKFPICWMMNFYIELKIYCKGTTLHKVKLIDAKFGRHWCSCRFTSMYDVLPKWSLWLSD